MSKQIGTTKNLTKYVVFSISIVIIYTIAEFILSIITEVSHDTLSTCVYGFFGGELVLLAMIKIFKIRRTDI